MPKTRATMALLPCASCQGGIASLHCKSQHCRWPAHLCFARWQGAAQVQHSGAAAYCCGYVAVPAVHAEAVLAGCAAHILAGELLKANHALHPVQQKRQQNRSRNPHALHLHALSDFGPHMCACNGWAFQSAWKWILICTPCLCCQEALVLRPPCPQQHGPCPCL